MAQTYEEILAGIPIRFPDDENGRSPLYDLGKRYLIDESVTAQWNTGRVAPQFTSITHAKAFMREALGRATSSGQTAAADFLLVGDIEDWERGDELAGLAEQNFAVFLRWLRSAGGDESVVRVLGQMRRWEGQAFAESLNEARTLAEGLLATEDILARFQAFTSEVGTRLRKERRNPGDPVKAAFVYELADAWVTLTGKRPGKNTKLEGNPFLRLAAAGWVDMGGAVDKDATTFGQAALDAWFRATV